MAEILYRGKKYSSLGELPVPKIRETAALLGLLRQPRPKRPEIIKHKFGNLDFVSYKGANLPPSPETFHLADVVGQVINRVNRQQDRDLILVDIGTGSGVIPITVASRVEGVSNRNVFVGTDISGRALEVAAINVAANSAPVELRKRDMFDDLVLEFGRVDVLVFNPPFYYGNRIPRKVRTTTFIPQLAVDGGEDSLDYYRKFFEGATETLKSSGIAVVQIQDYKLREISEIAAGAMRGAEIAALKGPRGRYSILMAGDKGLVDVAREIASQNQLVGSRI